MQAIHQAMATTIAACGDVNRQVVSSVNPYLSSQHRIVQEWTQKLSDHFITRTRAYHEIWLEGEKITAEPEEEPICGDSYQIARVSWREVVCQYVSDWVVSVSVNIQ